MQAAAFHKLSSFIATRPLTVLLLLFFISVLVRLPNLNRPLSKHHEANAALVLINAEAWDAKSPSFYNFVPVNAYHYPGDNWQDKDNLAGGYIINTSFGTLWYILPYYFFKLLHVAPSPLWLQVYNLCLHLITLLLLYHLLLIILKNSTHKIIIALLTTVMYMFAPGPLWFHGNGYVHEVAVLPFILGAILLFIQELQEEKSPVWKSILLWVLIYAGIMCDWLMCFVALAMFIVTSATYFKKQKHTSLFLMFIIGSSVIAALVVTAFQFSFFMGFDNYLQAMQNRYVQRGLTGSSEKAGIALRAGIVSFYAVNYGLMLLVTFIALLWKRSRKFIGSHRLLQQFLIAAIVVCIAHHIVFFGFTSVHDYSVLKTGLFISILSAIVIINLKNRWYQLLLTMLIVGLNVTLYYAINKPGEFAVNGHPYHYFQVLGEKIKSVSNREEYVFSDVPEFSPVLVYYSKRYYRVVKDIDEAKELFQQLPGQQAIFIHTDGLFNFQSFIKMKK